MSTDTAEIKEKQVPLNEGYQPFEKGYHPINGNLDTSNPPKGGSGVPKKEISSGNGKE